MTPQQQTHNLHQHTQQLITQTTNTIKHIQQQQQDALTTGNTHNNNPHNISDPTGNTATSQRLAPYAAKQRAISQALTQAQQALDRVDHTLHAALEIPAHKIIDPEPRCPGWTQTIQQRPGGCGNILEHYTRTDRTKGTRNLCVACRKAQQRHNRKNNVSPPANR